MKVFLWGIGLLLMAFLLHLVIWRFRIPRRQRPALLAVFFGFLTFSFIILARYGCLFGGLAPSHPSEFVLIAVLYGSMTLGYLSLSVALEGDSPSLVMVKMIQEAGPDGFPADRFEAAVRMERWIRSRMGKLAIDKMASIEDGRYRISRKGKRLMAYYDIYNRLAKLDRKST